jgi:hypothetical protein
MAQVFHAKTMNVLDPRRAAEEFEARSLVRSFSLDVVQREPDNVIAQGLHQVVGPAKAVVSREWSSYYQSAEYMAESVFPSSFHRAFLLC